MWENLSYSGGDRFDNIEGDIPYDNVPGQWDGIYFYPESFENNLSNVVVKNATRGMTFYPSKTGYKKSCSDDTVVQNSLEYGIVSTNCDITASNSLFVNSRGRCTQFTRREIYIPALYGSQLFQMVFENGGDGGT